MKFLKYSFILSIVTLLAISCSRNSDVFPELQKGANVRLIKDANFPVFIDAENIPNSRIVINGYSENDDIEKIELFLNYAGASIDTLVLLKTIQGSEISNGLLPELNFTTQQLADAIPGFAITDMGAGDKLDIVNVTTMNDGRVYPNQDIIAGTEISGTDTTTVMVNNIAPSIDQGATASFTTKLTYFIACPFVADDAVGQYLITRDDFVTSLDYDTPIECIKIDETTMLFTNLFMHPEMYDVSIVVDLASGAATVSRQAAWHCDNFGCGFGEGRVDGGGFFLSCVGFVTLDLTHTVDAGSFGTFKLELQKQ